MASKGVRPSLSWTDRPQGERPRTKQMRSHKENGSAARGDNWHSIGRLLSQFRPVSVLSPGAARRLCDVVLQPCASSLAKKGIGTSGCRPKYGENGRARTLSRGLGVMMLRVRALSLPGDSTVPLENGHSTIVTWEKAGILLPTHRELRSTYGEQQGIPFPLSVEPSLVTHLAGRGTERLKGRVGQRMTGR